MIKIHKNDVKTVTTWNGREVSIENCKRIGKKDPQYYEMNVDCFYVLNEKGEYKWTRLNTGKIAYNVESGKYELIKFLQENENLVKGIYNEKSEQGYFKFNPYTNVVLNDDYKDDYEKGTLCISGEIAEKLGFVEYLGTGTYVNPKINGLSKNSLQKKAVYRYKNLNKLSYNADNNNKLFLNIIKEYNQNKKYISFSPNTTLASKLLPYSFGIELESSNGFIPKHLLGPLGVVPLRDGSLRKEDGTEPYEYTTIPLEGDYGLETIKLLCSELTKRCDFDEKCSTHIHLGNLKKRTPEFVIAFYKLAFNLQNEIFEMFPAYKSEPERYVKNFHKNYCQKLPDLQLDNFNFNSIKSVAEAKRLTKDAFDRIYYFLSDNTVPVTDETWNLNTLKHPKGDMDKWNFHSRYMWVNLHPYMFSQKQTIEWRLHTPTFNHVKVSNWLFICAGIIQFAEQFTNEILKNEVPFSLMHVLSCYSNNFFKSFYETEYSQNVAKYLQDYVEFRKIMMKKSFENKDFYAYDTIEFKKDSKFTFSSAGLNSLY